MASSLPSRKAHTAAALQALLVTFLWSTSWVLIKIGLADIPALTFAGMRYSLAFLCLLPFAARHLRRSSSPPIAPRQWLLLIVLGIVYYTIVQGAQFVGLTYLPANMVSLTLNFTSLVVAVMGILWLQERPTRLGWIGVALSIFGGWVYFYPLSLPAGQAFGLLVAVIGMLANAAAAILGRRINARENLPPVLVTTISMGIGGGLLLLLGGLFQEIPRLNGKGIAIILWLALVNTAFAFTLWNHTLRYLSAMESTLINSAMLIQIALLAWIFLGEDLSLQKWVGLALAGFGAAAAQFRQQLPSSPAPDQKHPAGPS
jgi:drug/metabolite transporter (DMT)-like permease